MKKSKNDNERNDWWPFVAGLAIGFIVALVLAAHSIGEIKGEHNAKYHAEEAIGW